MPAQTPDVSPAAAAITASPLWATIARYLGMAPEHYRRTRRPFVTLTYAQSLDGSIAARPGHPLALSGSQSQAFTHTLRAAHDAILVGIGTVLADNPRLNVRLVPGNNPQPIVLDSRLRFPTYARLLGLDGHPWIATCDPPDPERRAALEALGARVLCLPAGSHGFVDLPALLTRLGEEGIITLMVEGGSQIITSFLASRLVDQLIITLAPLLVGGLPVINKYFHYANGSLPRLQDMSSQPVGDDLVLHAIPRWTAL